jgi:LEA14-like dessication related protein
MVHPARSALAAALALVSSACSKPQPPTLAPERATVTAVDAQAIHLDVTLTAKNPNSVDLTVSDVTAHVVLAQKIDLGSMTLPKAYTLPAGQATSMDAPMTVPWGDVNALTQLATAESVPFTVDGTVELGGSLLHVTVPYHLTGTMTRQQLLGATLRSLVPGLALPR